MAKNKPLTAKAAHDIDQQIKNLLKRLGNPEPPLDLRMVRELENLDRGYYSANDPSLLKETVSKLRIAGKQVILRPMLLVEAVRKMDVRALYFPDQKRILLDKSQPHLKHRWNEAHEIGHSLIPWHAGAMLGDNDHTLIPSCHAKIEHEANFAAARMLFLRERFSQEARDLEQNMDSLKSLAKTFGNTNTSTFWRCVETWGEESPILGLITGHPHPAKRKDNFDPNDPCRYFIQSPLFAARFSNLVEKMVFEQIVSYCSSNAGGPLGGSDVVLTDDNGDDHVFSFETFSFHHHILTLGLYVGPRRMIIAA